MKVRFSISNLLLLTAIVGIVIAWYLDRTQLNKKYQANTASLKTVLGRVDAYDTEIQPLLKQLSDKYRPRYRRDDIDYYRRECDDLELEIEQTRKLFSKSLSPLTQTEIRSRIRYSRYCA